MLLEQEDTTHTLAYNEGLTPLAHAAKAGEEGIVKLLLEGGDVDLDSPAKGDRTPGFRMVGRGLARTS